MEGFKFWNYNDNVELKELELAGGLFKEKYPIKSNNGIIEVCRLYPRETKILHLSSPWGIERSDFFIPETKIFSRLRIGDWRYIIFFDPKIIHDDNSLLQ